MAASEATQSFGTLFQRGDGVTPTEGFTTVAEVKDIDAPELSRDIHEVTHQQSPDEYKEKIGGLRDGGEVSFILNFLPDNATQDNSTGLLADFHSNTKKNYRLLFPDAGATTWTFPGLVSSFKAKAPVNGVLEADCTITVCGKPTIA